MSFLGFPFSTASREEVLDVIFSGCGSSRTVVIVTPNAQHVASVGDEADAAYYHSADLMLCDSKVIALLGRLHGRRIPVHPGADVVQDLLQDARSRNIRIGAVGPSKSDVAMLANQLGHEGVFCIECQAELGVASKEFHELASTAATADWEILLVCLGHPKQERLAHLIAQQRRRAGVILCVGAALDFMIGRQKRAPALIRHFGLEWLFRLLSDPVRMWRRYLLISPRIIRHLRK